MSSISIRTRLGRSNKNSKQAQTQASQTFPVFSIMIMIGILTFLGLLLFSQPSATIASSNTSIAPQTLSLSGAVTSRIDLGNIDTAAVACTSTGIVVNGTAPMNYTVNYSNTDGAVSSNLSLDGTNTLNLSINSATVGIAPNVFTAYEGVVYAQNGRTYINAFLTNDAGQPLYINAAFACN